MCAGRGDDAFDERGNGVRAWSRTVRVAGYASGVPTMAEAKREPDDRAAPMRVADGGARAHRGRSVCIADGCAHIADDRVRLRTIAYGPWTIACEPRAIANRPGALLAVPAWL